MRRAKLTIILSAGLVSLTLAITLTAYVLGLLPDGHRAELDARAKVAEALAVQLAGQANRGEIEALEDTLRSVVERNGDVLSAALVDADGAPRVSAGDHARHWTSPGAGRSSPTHVQVPLKGPDGEAGGIEIAFAPASAGARVLGVPATFFLFLAFLAATGFLGTFLILRRSIRQLNPSRVIPERVQKAFDTISEGVIILDERERILLMNDAFRRFHGGDGPAVGSRINTLSWRMADGRAQAGGYPWHVAIHKGQETREELISLRTAGGAIRNFNSNATVIQADDERTIGAIVTLADVTGARRSREELATATRRLEEAEREIERRREELERLARHDALTGALNRNAFLLDLDVMLREDDIASVTLFMVDITGLEAINERWGPVVGDEAVVRTATVLTAAASPRCRVGRHGGDELCLAVPGLDPTEAAAVADAIGREVAAVPLREGLRVRVRTGVAALAPGRGGALELVHAAIRALRAAAPDTEVAMQPAADRTADAAADRTGDAAAPVSGTDSAERRVAFEHRLAGALDLAAGRDTGVLVLDLSVLSWEYLLEALGEALGARVMDELEARLRRRLRDNANVLALAAEGRVLVEIGEVASRDDAEWIVRDLLRVTGEPLVVGGRELYLTCKVGAALSPHDGTDAAALLRNANIAMRRAREDNLRDGFRVYAPDMMQASLRRLDIETGIRAALANDEFALHFQPIVCARTGRLAAAEALLRCDNPLIRNVRMDHVIDVAEQSALIAEIDLWVLRAGLKQMGAWIEAGLNLPKVSLNISAKQLTNVAFMDTVHADLRALPFSPSRVQIEVTETAKMADVGTAAPQLKRLQQLGVHIALDDFGTGQASLTYLQRLHPDVVKIDRSFVTDVNSNHANATLVGAMTVMAHCLGLQVVVEGVEEHAELDFLRETRCDFVQGYLVSKPMPAPVMTDWLELFGPRDGAATQSAIPVPAAAPVPKAA